ncbi:MULTISPECIES: hypothetical protein [Vibrio]|uniref:Uncharacterized protein n=1 Tax=Vibrio splendidus TaxID=29497 RepID=A0A2N7JP87_VIBSP|nr:MULTISPECIES: hypothetical protein [Vibrio]PME40972.1 hypothetical protein BCV36_19405 [Vibrio cyclitrophicus]PME53486.1 hypothetical protein BCV37_23115 [Vibrio cyclitrophicus]PMM45989.1 hypothetical protein BCT54_25185 [Vibrio splendidus]
MTKDELLKLVEIDEILDKIFNETNTEQDLKDLLEKLDGVINLGDLKNIIRNCLNKKFDSFEKFRKCIFDNIALKNKPKKKVTNKPK